MKKGSEVESGSVTGEGEKPGTDLSQKYVVRWHQM
jgi:hypothetical protein